MKATLASLALILVSCSATPEQRAQIRGNLFKDAVAGGVGYMTGGPAGAAAGALTQFERNHTSAKQPVPDIFAQKSR